LGIWVVESLKAVDWQKYWDGPKMTSLVRFLAEVGVGDLAATFKQLVEIAVQEAGVQMVDQTLHGLSSCLLLILFLGFLLIDSAVNRINSKEPLRWKQRKIIAQVLRGDSLLTVEDAYVPLAGTFMGRLRIQMRIYLHTKFYLSLFKAIVIGAVLALLRVDLWIIWTVLTFVLNFAPLGSLISTGLPMPFVFFDPTKTFWMLCIVILWPIVVHNVVGNVIEPRIFASTLSLHPVTVLLAMTFWTAVWGMFGALVCVPLTDMLHVLLHQASHHPYATPLRQLLEGDVRSENLRHGLKTRTGLRDCNAIRRGQKL